MTSLPPVQPELGPPPSPDPRAPQRAERAERPPWAPWTAPAALVAGFAAALIGGLAVAVIAAIAGVPIGDEAPGITIGGTAVQDFVLIGTALAFAGMARRPRAADFGLRPVRLGFAARWLAIVWFGYLVFSLVWVAALKVEERDNLVQDIGADKSTAALVAFAVLVTVLAPIAEEVFFRGYFFTALRGWRGVWPAALITGIVFGGIHAGSAPAAFLVPLAAFGVGLCLLYWRTGSLYPCIALHCLNNSWAFGLSQHWDWQVPVLMVGANLAIAGLLAPLARRGRPRLA